MELLIVPVALAVGGLLAVQAGANLQLSKALASPPVASALQLGVGAAILLLLAAVSGSIPALRLLPEQRPWTLVGGVASAVYITSGILLFPRVGAVVSTGLFITGQMAASVVLDGYGLLGVARRPFDVLALLGLAAVLAGAALVVRAQAGDESLRARPLGRRAGWLLLGLAAGAVLPIQGAVNAQLRLGLQAPLAVGAVSFLVALASMIAALPLLTVLGAFRRPALAQLPRVPWWGWLGGVCGATYVTSVFLLIPLVGAAPTVALIVAGQQLASAAVDHLGLLRLARRALSGQRLLGIAVLLMGVALVQLA